MDPVHFDSLAASSNSDRVNLFNRYFHSVFSNTSRLPSINDLPDLSDLTYTIDSVEFTELEVYDVLISLVEGIDLVLVMFVI